MHVARAAIVGVISGLLYHASSVTQEKTSEINLASSVDGDRYAGNGACQPCHKDQVLSYSHTAHYLTSQLANKNSILGSLEKAPNVLMIANPESATENPGLYFRMEARDGAFYQTAVIGWPGQLRERSGRMDV